MIYIMENKIKYNIIIKKRSYKNNYIINIIVIYINVLIKRYIF